MRSMTGYGRGRTVLEGRQFTVEISSVNRKQAEVVLSLPRGLNELEARLRDEINAGFSRGRLTVSVALHEVTGKGQRHINIEAARDYHAELKKLRSQLKLDGTISLESVLRGPGVVMEGEQPVDAESCWKPLRETLQQALKDLVKMREKEGKALAKDLAARLKFLSTTTDQMEAAAPHVMEHHRKGMLERAKKAGIDIDANDERLLREIVFFADRSDISEEVTRLRSHLKQAQDCLRKDEPVGRTLDFIIQEMNREVNTIGSKANDIGISRLVVDCKTELEKIREQAQNVE